MGAVGRRLEVRRELRGLVFRNRAAILATDATGPGGGSCHHRRCPTAARRPGTRRPPAHRLPARTSAGAPPRRNGRRGARALLSLIHISEPTRLLSISYA